MTEPSKNIVIVGGGFGGSTVARELRARLPESHMLILISEESYLTFNPLLPEVVGASIFPEQVVAPLRQMLNLSGASRFIMGHVVAIDRAAKTVTCSSLAGETVVPYSELILAFGNRGSPRSNSSTIPNGDVCSATSWSLVVASQASRWRANSPTT